MSEHGKDQSEQNRTAASKSGVGRAALKKVPEETREASGRGSRDLWLEAACDLLMEQGVASVMIQPLSKRLQLSRTSFYWFFEHREALLEALLERWRDRNTGAIREQAEAYAETVGEAILNLFDCWLDPRLFDTKFEFAVRSWALQSPAVAAEINSADQQRLEIIASIFRRFDYPAEIADVRARAVYLSQIGYISMQTVETAEDRMRRIPHYVEIFTGKAASRQELNRFYGRYRFASSA